MSCRSGRAGTRSGCGEGRKEGGSQQRAGGRVFSNCILQTTLKKRREAGAAWLCRSGVSVTPPVSGDVGAPCPPRRRGAPRHQDPPTPTRHPPEPQLLLSLPPQITLLLTGSTRGPPGKSAALTPSTRRWNWRRSFCSICISPGTAGTRWPGSSTSPRDK